MTDTNYAKLEQLRWLIAQNAGRVSMSDQVDAWRKEANALTESLTVNVYNEDGSLNEKNADVRMMDLMDGLRRSIVSSRVIHAECFTCRETTVTRFRLNEDGGVIGLVCSQCECERLPRVEDFNG